MAPNTYHFVRVETFFNNLPSWPALTDVRNAAFDETTRTLSLSFDAGAATACLLLSLVQKDAFRIRFNPAKSASDDYTQHNSRAVVMDTFDALQRVLQDAEPFTVDQAEDGDDLVLTTFDDHRSPAMKLTVGRHPFHLTAYLYQFGAWMPLWESGDVAIRYRPRDVGDYAIVQTLKRPASAVYAGFGEQGGRKVIKNCEQMNFFSFDNYTYNQVYGLGPLDHREPLYHADPFYLELNGFGGNNGAYGLFVDNPAQVLMDTGVIDAGQTQIGVRFGDLDYYCFLGRTPADILDGFTSLVGHARLKPRYALGYHQGCYGYENRGALEWAASKYRQYGIPLDGLHIDVDIQNDYQTFTINQERFPEPKQMFAELKAMGVKCATNITPIISNGSKSYATYTDGFENEVFVADVRAPIGDQAVDRQTQVYEVYEGGSLQYRYEKDLPTGQGSYASAFNSGAPYVGEVNYGGSLGTAGHYPDLGRKSVRQWWGTQYQYLFDQGLEMVWQDMTTPAIRDTRGDMKGFPFQLLVTDDFLSGQKPALTPAVKSWNLYSYNLHKATYHGLNHLRGREDLRNFIVGRGSFTGMHRFAALWTGDNASTWDFLRINVAQVLSLGLCGQAISGQDIGGFACGEAGQHWVGPELLMRWTMAGAFLPWFRNHYVRKGQKDFQEPFQYQEWFQTYHQPVPDPDLYAMVIPVCRTYIRRRYRMMQLFYDLMFENTQCGLPICRPLFLTDPQDATLLTGKVGFLNDEFCVGENLLIAPILDPQTECGGRRSVYLPAGSNWFCYMDDLMPLDHAIPGGSTIEYDASLETYGDHIAFLLPTFVRAGAILPLIEVENYVGERNAGRIPNPITFSIYPGRSGEATCYLDDGISRSSAPVRPAEQGGDEMAAGRYRQICVQHDWTGPMTRRVQIRRGHDGYTPPYEIFYYLSVLREPGCQPLAKVSVNGSSLSASGCARKEDIAGDAGWFHDAKANADIVKVPDTADIDIELIYAPA